MPYAMKFTKQVEPSEADEYINDCCIGGDVVLDRLLPVLGCCRFEGHLVKVEVQTGEGG